MTQESTQEQAKEYVVPEYMKREKTEDYASSLAYGINVFLRGQIKNEHDIAGIIEGAAAEISKAMRAKFGGEDEAACAWETAVEKHLNTPQDAREDSAAQAYYGECQENLIALALFCRQNGIMPYYVTMIIAYGLLYCKNCSGLCEMKDRIERQGLKEAVSEVFRISTMPDLVQMIHEHYLHADGTEIEDPAMIALKKRAYELGFGYEKKYKGCSQCALLALFDITGETDELLFQEATGLSGGMAICNDGACGGYTGGILMMGKYVGRRLGPMKIDGDKENQYTAYYMAQELHDKFVETFGSVVCKDIHCSLFGTWYCLREKEVRDAFEAAGAHQDKCNIVIANACVWISEILVKYGYLHI